MKWLTILMACAGIMSLGFLSRNRQYKDQERHKAPGGIYRPVAVLELFTSEGCSSCPPADQLLPSLAGSDSSVIALSYHVDYWNYLGWTDPFSRPEHAERQRDYVRQLGLESAYTPQLVINGKYEAVGSNRGRLTELIRQALREKAGVDIMIKDLSCQANNIRFEIQASGQLTGTRFRIALVQKKAVMQVRAGENRGATLTHFNIVRTLKELPAESSATVTIPVPPKLEKENILLVVFAQRSNDLVITGASMASPD